MSAIEQPPPMAHDSRRSPVRLAPDLTALLASLRRAIRCYVCLEGLAALCIVLGMAFWISLAIDWYFEPSAAYRVVAAGAVAAGSLYVFARYIVRRLLVKLRDTSLALLIERRYGRFDGSLLTAVELAERPETQGPLARQFYGRVARQAVVEAGRVRWQYVLNPRPLVRKAAAASLLVGSIALFAVLAGEAFHFWIDRMMLSPEPWPRQTRLTVEGFTGPEAGPRIAKVAHGDPFLLVVRADTGLKKPPPDSVVVRYRREDGLRGREVMTRIGRAIPGRDAHQVYQFTFQDVTLPVMFDVSGGDDRISDLSLVVVQRPELTGMAVECKYPDYLGMSDAEIPVSGVMDIPEGTRVKLRGTCSKQLRRVTALDAETDQELPVVLEDSAPNHQFSLAMGPLTRDQVIFVQLEDVDGATNRQPYRVAMRSVQDDPPRIAVSLKGIGTAITADARVPLHGEVADDHAVAGLAFDYRIDDGSVKSLPIAPGETGPSVLPFEQAIDTKLLPEADRLQVGSKFQIAVQAKDTCGLDRGPQQTSSPFFLLDVVAPEQLRFLLDRRELLLRRRFETIHAELTGTRDLIASIPRAEAAADADAKPEETAGPSGSRRSDTQSEGVSGGRTDPGETDAESGRQVRLLRAVQNAERAAHETMEVSAAFQEIHDEIVNNRMDTPAILDRLNLAIIQPLRQIGQQSLPRLHDRYVELSKTAANATRPADADPFGSAVRETDSVLVEMQRVLDKMLELESYNEAVQILRGILDDQQQLNQNTRDQRTQRLRKLIGESEEPAAEERGKP